MTKADSVLDAALQLDEEQRAAVALRLLESLDGPEDPDRDEAWAEELGRRVAAVRDGTARLIPASEVRERIVERLSKIHG